MRFYQALAAGRVPIIQVDSRVSKLPFDDVIMWDKTVIISQSAEHMPADILGFWDENVTTQAPKSSNQGSDEQVPSWLNLKFIPGQEYQGKFKVPIMKVQNINDKFTECQGECRRVLDFMIDNFAELILHQINKEMVAVANK